MWYLRTRHESAHNLGMFSFARRASMLRPNARIVWPLICLCVVAILAGLGGWAYVASQHVPDFYSRALHAEPAKQREASTEMFNATMALVQDVRRKGDWEAEFTQQQINGWLAVDLKENHSDLLDENVHEPRVSLEPGRATLAYRYETDAVDTVVSVSFDVYVAGPNVVAVRIEKARAGNLPIPLTEVLDTLTEAAKEAQWRLEWRQDRGKPVAMVHVPEVRDEEDDSKRLHIQVIDIRKGKIYLSGRTEIVDARSADDSRPMYSLRIASQPGVKVNVQR